MPPAFPFLTRRTTLVAAPLAGLSACEWGPDRPDVETPAPTPTDASEDTTRVTAALASITSTAELVARVAARHRRLARPLADLTALHLAHATLLQEGVTEPPSASPPGPVPADRRQAHALVVREERGLQEELAALSVEVASGTLARALASMSAAVAQHLTVLPAPEERR